MTAKAVTLRPYLSTPLIALCAFAATPAAAETETGTARVVTVRPLTLIKVADLDFGDIAAGATPGSVNINPASGVRTTAGGVVPLGGTPHEAEFAGAARFGFLLTVAISASPTLVRIGGGGNMTTVLAVDGGTGVRLFPGTGGLRFKVGGRLNVGANQPTGNYRGQFTLTVNYF